MVREVTGLNKHTHTSLSYLFLPASLGRLSPQSVLVRGIMEKQCDKISCFVAAPYQPVPRFLLF